MTTTYEPTHSLYRDEADVRGEVQRVFDVCESCRACVDHCSSFSSLFSMLDALDDRDAGAMTPAQQDLVVDQCFQCKLCEVSCPYTPAQSELAIDFPRLVLRATAMRHSNGHVPMRSKTAAGVLGRADVFGKMATRLPIPMNRVVAAAPGTAVRRALARVLGLSSSRRLSPFTHRRFSAWFAQRPKIRLGKKQADVAVYPTCLVEYQATGIGQDLVKVYERNGVECSISGARCCGAPLLHSGDVDRFAKVAAKNVAILASEIRSGRDVVVPQPSCGHVIRHDYVDHVDGVDATLVAEHVYDASEYLMRIHEADDTVLDTDFDGHVPTSITYHSPSTLRSPSRGRGGRDLLRLTGAAVTSIRVNSGAESLWALRSDHDEALDASATRLAEQIDRAGGEVVSGACHLSNEVIAERTGRVPLHPLQVVARAYGFPDER